MQFTILNFVTDEVEVDGNVFHVQVKDWVGTKICRPHIVAVDRRSQWNVYAKFKERFNLKCFGCSKSYNTIF